MPIYLADAGHVADAALLLSALGASAAVQEAELRAGRCRDLGNHVHFCRWRQVGRLIDLLADDRVVGTVH